MPFAPLSTYRKTAYWIGQYLLAASTMFALLAAIDLLRGDDLATTWATTLAWSAAAAAFFIGARWQRSGGRAQSGPG